MSHINWRPETADEEAQMMEALDPEEREILATQNAAEYTFPPPASAEEVRHFQTIAHHTLAKSERIGLRLTKAGLAAIKIRAAQQGIGYQTLIASLVHQYVTGQLVPRDQEPPQAEGRIPGPNG
ncbi:MAG TPA: antitoxin [Candidatus Tectomicrobia bacterium]